MSRPKFPTGTILTTEMIRRIKEDQAVYDRNPDAWERREREAWEEYEREQQRMIEEEQEFYRRHQHD